MKNRTRYYIIFLFIFFFSCDSNRVFEKNSDIENYLWVKDKTFDFLFEISDTTLTYNILLNVRHTVHYPFTNIFIKYNLNYPDGVTSSELTDILLSDVKNERWLGDALGDIVDLTSPAKNLRNIKFKTPGKYKISLEQYMRDDTLLGVMAVGVRVEKVRSEK